MWTADLVPRFPILLTETITAIVEYGERNKIIFD